MRGERDIQRVVVHVGMHTCRNDMAGAAIGVFRFVVVEHAGFGDDLGHRKCAVAHYADGEFASGNVFLDQRRCAEAPGAGDFGTAIVAALDDLDADR